MRPGFRTSEFWIAALWSGKAALAVAALASPYWLSAWDRAALLPAACLIAWCASVIANNYVEYRFQLKAQAAKLDGESKTALREQCERIGFVSGEPEEPPNEEQGNE